MVLLTLFSVLLVLLVFVVLAVALIRISGLLREIGGTPTSFLAKLRLGLRAIERETSHLGPQVTVLNDGLVQVRDGLDAIDQRLVETLEAAQRQEA